MGLFGDTFESGSPLYSQQRDEAGQHSIHRPSAMCQTRFGSSAQFSQSPVVLQQFEQAIISKALRPSRFERDTTVALTDCDRSNLSRWISKRKMTKKPGRSTFYW